MFRGGRENGETGSHGRSSSSTRAILVSCLCPLQIFASTFTTLSSTPARQTSSSTYLAPGQLATSYTESYSSNPYVSRILLLALSDTPQGFFSSLFTAGFIESSSSSGLQHVDIVFDDRNITRAGVFSIHLPYQLTHYHQQHSSMCIYHSPDRRSLSLGYASHASMAAVPFSTFPRHSSQPRTIPLRHLFLDRRLLQMSPGHTILPPRPSFSLFSRPPSTSPSLLLPPKH